MTIPSIEVERVEPLAAARWDQTVRTLPRATFFHGRAWARVLSASYQFEPIYLVAKQDGRVVGVLPLMEADSWMTGRRGIALPFSDTCEPLAESDVALRSLWAAALAEGRRRGWRYCELRGGRDRLGAPASVSYFGHTLDLTQDAARVLANTAESARRAIRKAERSGVEIEFSRQIEAVYAFHRLLCLTRKRLGLPPQPLQFFENLHDHVLAQNQGWVVLAKHEGTPVAGAVFLHFGSTVLFKYGASDHAFQHLRANNLLFWRSILWHADAGFETLDFGRTDIGHEGLRRFKLGWGAQEHAIDYVRHHFRRDEFVSTPHRLQGWSAHLFRHLPESLSRAIGAALYKHAA